MRRLLLHVVRALEQVLDSAGVLCDHVRTVHSQGGPLSERIALRTGCLPTVGQVPYPGGEALPVLGAGLTVLGAGLSVPGAGLSPGRLHFCESVENVFFFLRVNGPLSGRTDVPRAGHRDIGGVSPRVSTRVSQVQERLRDPLLRVSSLHPDRSPEPWGASTQTRYCVTPTALLELGKLSAPLGQGL